MGDHKIIRLVVFALSESRKFAIGVHFVQFNI